MRLPRLRRMLGPFEPRVRAAWHLGRDQSARLRRRGLVVLSTSDDHGRQARALADRLGPGIVGVWVCCQGDVADLGTMGWFVVRLDPSSIAAPDVRAREVAAIVATWRRACRQLEVVDLDAGSSA